MRILRSLIIIQIGLPVDFSVSKHILVYGDSNSWGYLDDESGHRLTRAGRSSWRHNCWQTAMTSR